MDDFISESSHDQKELIHLLHKVQAKYGYIPPDSLAQISKHLKISKSEVFGVLTFYKAFSLQPRGQHIITVCLGTACHVRGAPKILDEFRRRLRIEPGETTEDKTFTLETVNCVGACALGPIAIVDGDYHGQMKTSEVLKIVEKYKQGENSSFE